MQPAGGGKKEGCAATSVLPVRVMSHNYNPEVAAAGITTATQHANTQVLQGNCRAQHSPNMLILLLSRRASTTYGAQPTWRMIASMSPAEGALPSVTGTRR
jgi:hypothetical protein